MDVQAILCVFRLPENMIFGMNDLLRIPIKSAQNENFQSNDTLAEIELIDYKVRILDPESATAAATRVMIEFRDSQSEKTWTTVSVDRNVISASLNALVDGFEFALIEYASACMLCDDFFT